MIVASVVERLQTGAITRVVQYGTSVLPAAPYVVVRPQRDAIRGGRVLAVIPHFAADQQKFLEDYTFNKLSDLLVDFSGVTAEGVHFRVYGTQEWTDIITGNDDDTISMERLFLIPGVLF